MRIIKKRTLPVILGTLFVCSLLVAQSAFAAPHENNTRPGWGHGDDNHVHTGPPGHSNRPGDVEERFHERFAKFLERLEKRNPQLAARLEKFFENFFHSSS